MQPTETEVESATPPGGPANERDRDRTGGPGYVAAVPEAATGGDEYRPGTEPEYPVPTPEAGAPSNGPVGGRTGSGEGTTSPLTVQVEEAVQHNPFSRTDGGTTNLAGTDPGSPGYVDNSGPPGDPGPGVAAPPIENSQVPGYDAAGAAAAEEAKRRAEAEAAAQQEEAQADSPRRVPVDDLRPISPEDLASIYPGNGSSGQGQTGTIPPGAEVDLPADLGRPGIGPKDPGDGDAPAGVGHEEAPTSEVLPGAESGFTPPYDPGRDFPGRVQPGDVYGDEEPGGTVDLPPGFRGELPIDVGRPGVGINNPPGEEAPPTDLPTYDPPQAAPGHDLPTDLERPGAGPRFDPDENPVPPGYGGTTPDEDCGPDEDPADAAPPVGHQGPGYSAPPANGSAPGMVQTGAAAAAATGAALDAFYTGSEPDAPGSTMADTGSSGEPPAAASEIELLPADTGDTSSDRPILTYQSALPVGGPALVGADAEAQAAPDISEEIAALAARVRSLAVAPFSGNAGEDRSGDGTRNIAEFIRQMLDDVRDAVFQRGADDPQAQLASQIAELDSDSLSELTRLAGEPPIEQATDAGSDDF